MRAVKQRPAISARVAGFQEHNKQNNPARIPPAISSQRIIVPTFGISMGCRIQFWIVAMLVTKSQRYSHLLASADIE